jgi:hypothetical protein
MTSTDASAFVHAAVSERVVGASLYEFARTSPMEWRLMAAFR